MRVYVQVQVQVQEQVQVPDLPPEITCSYGAVDIGDDELGLGGQQEDGELQDGVEGGADVPGQGSKSSFFPLFFGSFHNLLLC